MANWIVNNFQQHKLRETKYNNSVCLNAENLDNIMFGFDTFFDTLLNFTDTIASIQVYPFDILPYYNTSGYNFLHTVTGTHRAITAYSIDYSAYYMSLGEFYVRPYFNNFADYKGYTQIRVFLPFMGYVDVDPNECMGKWLQFRLSVDFVTGKGMHILGVSDNSIEYKKYPGLNDDIDVRVIATYECDIGIDIPLGKSNIGDIKRNLLLGTIKTAASVAAASYVGSLPPPVTTTRAHTEYEVQGRALEKGSRLKTMRQGESNTVKTTTTDRATNKSAPIMEAVDGSIDTLNRLHIWGNTDRVNDAGLMWSMTGSVKVVIYRPKMLPADDEYDFLYGKPYGAVNTLKNLSGYTTISNFHLEGEHFATATKEELSLISDALIDGIILSTKAPPTPPTTVDFRINSLAYTALNGMTWAEWIEDGQGSGFIYDANGVYTPQNYIIIYNGSKVKSTDTILPVDYVAISQVVNFYVDTTAYTALRGMTWAEWIDDGQGGDFYYGDAAVYQRIGDVRYVIRDGSTNVSPNDTINPIIYRRVTFEL